MIHSIFLVCALGSLSSFILGAGSDHEVKLVSSGRDGTELEVYRKEAEEITQAALKLGFNLGKKHLLTFVPAGELGQLSAMGRYALPHWKDGAQIFQSMGRISGVLEFVT